jgi:CYTH domain
MASVARSCLALLATFLLVFGLHGQETCSEEVKLLLSPKQLQPAILVLQARKETHGRVYFYDTPALDLLSQGVILRLREGAEIDLTAKLRPLSRETFVDPSRPRERYKCEVDLNDGIENQSFSLQNKYVAAKAPGTGEELFQLLSKRQKKLLEDSKVQILEARQAYRGDSINELEIAREAAVGRIERGALGVAERTHSRSLKEGRKGRWAGHICRAERSCQQERLGVEYGSTLQNNDCIGSDQHRSPTVTRLIGLGSIVVAAFHSSIR